ncbi:MAG TPA: branched-chain amino acid ABC transporter ATP-binding protein/permease [Tepidisphaeraceae bacterium]|jgi:branched-chain amino acid transport system permease protein|nr:branched-chain amino acid ABC transporter ATP-binding protein/permease [Tepidisphaeraceae bacterium]
MIDTPSPNPTLTLSGISQRTSKATGWPDTFKANLPIPILLVAIWLLGMYVESDAVSTYNTRVIMLVGFNIILAVSLQLINGFSGQFSLGHAGFMAVGAYMAAYPAINLSQRLSDPAACAWFFITLAILASAIGFALLLLFWAVRASRKINPNLPAILLLLLIAWILVDFSKAAAYSTPPSQFIWTNLSSAVSHGFDSLLTRGIPFASKISDVFPDTFRKPICFIVLILGGGSCAAVVGLIVGLPALRLRGDYLAIATLGFAEIIRILIQNSQPLGGALGLTGIPKMTSFVWLYGFAAFTIIVIWRIAYSAKGRAIMAVREDEVAAAACGIDTTHQKVMAFIVGSFFGGIAGALFALHERSIAPYQFGLQKSIEAVVMVTLGGLGSISGAILAAIVLTVLLELLRDPPSLGLVGWLIVAACAIAMIYWSFQHRDKRWRSAAITILILCGLWELGVFLAQHAGVNLAQFRMIIYSLALILMMLLRPQGLLGGIELWPRRKPCIQSSPGEAVAPQGHNLSPTPATLVIDRVSRRFGGLCAVSEFSLSLKTGELIGLIGPNGAGKTTAFNLITGVYCPTSGTITLNQKRIDGRCPSDINCAGIARTFQNIRLFKNLTVLDNVIVAFDRSAEKGLLRTILRLPKYSRERASMESAGVELLQTLQLADKCNLLAKNLPYGDQRRLEIARALATQPKILLLDEPAAGMNPQEKSDLMQLIRFIRDHFNLGILLIEHDMKLVMNICQRITVLDHGETIAVGSPEEVQCNPKVIEAYLGEPQ